MQTAKCDCDRWAWSIKAYFAIACVIALPHHVILNFAFHLRIIFKVDLAWVTNLVSMLIDILKIIF